MIQHHACVLNQILFLSFYNLQFYITTTFICPSSPFAFYYRIHPLPKTGKTWRLNFPAQFDGPFVGAVKSIGLIQRIPPVFASRRKKNEGKGWDDQRWKAGGRGKSGRVLEERTALASVGVGGCRIYPLSPPLPSIRSLFPLYGRASGQFEITLSPFQCVQSKLQFKSSLAGTPEL